MKDSLGAVLKKIIYHIETCYFLHSCLGKIQIIQGNVLGRDLEECNLQQSQVHVLSLTY